MNNIPPHLRAKIRGDALKAINSRAFLTPYDAFIMGVEYALANGSEQNVDQPSSPAKSEMVESWISSISNESRIGKRSED